MSSRNLNALSVFATVVEAGSFTAAAERLSMSKSAVSKQIGRLEREWATKLLHRSTRRLVLTDVGAAVYQHCERILAEAEAAELAAARLQAQPRGVLKVSAPMSFGALHVVPAMRAFLAENPEVEIELSLSDRIVDLAEEGYDVAIRVTRLPDERLVAHPLALVRWVVCASETYLRTAGEPGHPSELVDHACLIYPGMNAGETWHFRDSERPLKVQVTGPVRVNNSDSLRRAAVDGLGVALLPSFVCGDDLREGALQPLLLDYLPEAEQVFAVHLPNRVVSPKVRAWVEFLRARLGKPPYWDAWRE